MLQQMFKNNSRHAGKIFRVKLMVTIRRSMENGESTKKDFPTNHYFKKRMNVKEVDL